MPAKITAATVSVLPGLNYGTRRKQHAACAVKEGPSKLKNAGKVLFFQTAAIPALHAP